MANFKRKGDVIRTNFRKTGTLACRAVANGNQSAFAQEGYGVAAFTRCAREDWCSIVDITRTYLSGSPGRSERGNRPGFALWATPWQSSLTRVREDWCALTDVIRTDYRQDVITLYSMVPHDMKEWLDGAVDSYAAGQCSRNEMAA